MRTPLPRVLPQAVALLLVTGTAHAQAPLTKAALNGEWNGTLALDNGVRALSLQFQITDSVFDGSVYSDGQPFGKMQGGTIRADSVHFTVDRFDFTGVVQGVHMKLALIVYNGSTRSLVLTKRPDVPAPRSTDP